MSSKSLVLSQLFLADPAYEIIKGLKAVYFILTWQLELSTYDFSCHGLSSIYLFKPVTVSSLSMFLGWKLVRSKKEPNRTKKKYEEV